MEYIIYGDTVDVVLTILMISTLQYMYANFYKDKLCYCKHFVKILFHFRSFLYALNSILQNFPRCKPTGFSTNTHKVIKPRKSVFLRIAPGKHELFAHVAFCQNYIHQMFHKPMPIHQNLYI